MSWTPERCDDLRRLLAERLSFSKIAAALGGGLTRNACIGKAKRLGLSNGRPSCFGGGPRKPKETKPKTRRVERIVRASRNHSSLRLIETQEPIEMLRDLPADEIPIEQRKTILELTEDTCRYPYGEPGHPDFFFCGGEPLASLPYCAMHARIAYQPAPARRDHRPPIRRSA